MKDPGPSSTWRQPIFLEETGGMRHAAIIVSLHFYQPFQASSEVEGREC